MSLVIGRLTLEDPESWSEQAGEGLGAVGGLPVAGSRGGLSVSPGLTTFTTSADTVAMRQRARRQFRAMIQNRPYALGPVYILWDQDTENSGWYAAGQASIEPADISGLVSAFWRMAPELRVFGRRRTHRRAVSCYVRDRRLSTTPRDYKRSLFSTDFSTLTALAQVALPSTTSDHLLHGAASAAVLTTAESGYDSASIRTAIGVGDLAVISFEQAETDRNRGDVVLYDRQGVTTMLTTGPQTSWEEVYGPDQPLTAPDVPVLENAICRVSYDTANTDGFRFDVWTGSAWAEQGRLTVQRYDGSWTDLDTLVSAQVMEWTPERAVLKVVMARAADAFAREEVFLTLQRGWDGPRIEVYPARTSAGAVAGSGVSFNAVAAATAHSAAVIDASDAAVGAFTAGSGGVVLAGAALGAASFTGENLLSLIREAETFDVSLAVLQAGAEKRTGSGSGPYGATRNFVQVRHQSAGYISAQLGYSSHHTHQDLENGDFTASAGTTLSAADGTATGGTAASTTRTAAADHVTLASFLGASNGGTYRIFARVRTTASTLNINAQTGAGFGVINGVTKNDASPVTTTSTSYVWLDLGTVTAANTTLTIRMWATAAATTYLDRVEAHPLQLRDAGNLVYDGPRDLAQAVLYDARPQPTLVAR